MRKIITLVIILVIIYQIANGNLLSIILGLVVVAINRDNYTDSHRRGRWW